MIVHVYKTSRAGDEYAYRYQTQLSGSSDLQSPYVHGSLAKIAAGVRQLAWDLRSGRDKSISVVFEPPVDIDWIPRDRTPCRCHALMDHEQDLFWKVFSSTREEARNEFLEQV